MSFDAPCSSERLASELKKAIDSKTKPPGSLGRLEQLASKIGVLQGTCQPRMETCGLTIFAGDHGIAADGVSAFPQEVTRQMVLNFLHGGAAANAIANALGVPLQVVDAGVAGEPLTHAKLLNHSLGAGTANFQHAPAMTQEQFQSGMEVGRTLGEAAGFDAVCFGEMGIGNTSSAALLCHKLTDIELSDLVGRGTGVDDSGLKRKLEVLRTAASRTERRLRGTEAMTEYGGFEILMMAGAMLGAASTRKIVIVDGFIATAAALVDRKSVV